MRAGGEVVLRNAAADATLPAGGHMEQVLQKSSGSEVHWATEVAALGGSAGRLVRRNIRLKGTASRLLVVDVFLRSLPPALSAGVLGGDDGSDGPCVLVLVDDVSSRVSAERRVAAGERLAAAGPLAAKVAHELNNPLDGVLRFVGLAERVAGEQARGYLSQVRDGLMRMADVIRALLEQGRPWQAAGERAELAAVLDEAVRALQPRAQSAGVSIVCDFDDRVEGTVEGSVFQVFCNVVKNALDAMPTGGILTIAVRPAGAQCEVRFEDTGCGLTEEEAARIFEPFHSTKPPGEGSGLGLTISREILARLGGTIAAAPRGEGGARITVRLPLRPLWKPESQEPAS